MSAREDLARLINNGVGVWRTPLEAADAIIAALAPQSAALDAVLALAEKWNFAYEKNPRQPFEFGMKVAADDVIATVNDIQAGEA